MNFYLVAMVKRFWTVLLMGLMLTTLASCGGGSSSSGSPLNGGGSSGTSTSGSIAVTLTDTSGNAATAIPSGYFLNATATVLNGSGSPVSGVLVTFTVSNSAGTISPTLGTAVTNSKGQAVVTLQPGTSTNAAGYISASTAISSTSSTISSGNVAFTNGASSSSSPTLALSFTSSPTSCTANTISSTCSIIASATLLDSSGEPVPNTPVSFTSTSTLSSINPSVGTALTNSSGVATVSIVPLSLSVALAQTGAAGQVSASATYNGTTVTAPQYFTVGETSLTLATTAPSRGAASIAAYGTTSISVQVNSNGSIYTSQPVTVYFASACQSKGLASLPASATTSNGIATVTYRDIGCGATVDTVTATVSGSSSQATAAITVAAPTPTSIQFMSANPSSESIVINGTGGVGRTSTAVLTFKVLDSSGNALPNALVNFSNNAPSVASLTTTQQTTDSNGEVIATVTAAAVGTFSITATLANTPMVSTISDSVVVSQGLPTNAAITVVPVTSNINGWNHVITDTITVYLTDKSGNAVAAGTPVSATTDSGQIQSSSGNSGGCIINSTGYCTLTYTTTGGNQGATHPIAGTNGVTRTGVSKITVTTTDGTNATLSAFTYIIWSTDVTYGYTLTGGYVSPTNTSSTGVIPKITAASSVITVPNCSLNATVVIADANGNPVAAGTTVTGASTQTGVSIGTITPATVPDSYPSVYPLTTTPTSNIGLIDETGDNYYPNLFYNIDSSSYVQGTYVTVPITISAGSGTLACSATGTQGAGSAAFKLTVTSQSGLATSLNFLLKYPA